MIKKSTLDEKFNYIKEKLGDNAKIYFEDLQRIYPDVPKSSIYWTASKLVEAGYLNRIRNGIYSFNEYKGKSAVYISKTTQNIRDLLDETGYEYYVSGLDIIQKFLHHIPEDYPIIIYIEKSAYAEIEKLLMVNDYIVTAQSKINEIYEKDYIIFNKSIVVINDTTSFEYQKNHIATIEKAFIDLFYAITRDHYPFALQELVRTYVNMIRLGVIDQKRLVKISYVRNMQHDIRFIVESKYISEEAFIFVEQMKREV